MCTVWVCTVDGEITRSAAIWGLVRPAASRRRTSSSRSVRPAGSAGRTAEEVPAAEPEQLKRGAGGPAGGRGGPGGGAPRGGGAHGGGGERAGAHTRLGAAAARR